MEALCVWAGPGGRRRKPRAGDGAGAVGCLARRPAGGLGSPHHTMKVRGESRCCPWPDSPQGIQAPTFFRTRPWDTPPGTPTPLAPSAPAWLSLGLVHQAIPAAEAPSQRGSRAVPSVRAQIKHFPEASLPIPGPRRTSVCHRCVEIPCLLGTVTVLSPPHVRCGQGGLPSALSLGACGEDEARSLVGTDKERMGDTTHLEAEQHP